MPERYRIIAAIGLAVATLVTLAACSSATTSPDSRPTSASTPAPTVASTPTSTAPASTSTPATSPAGGPPTSSPVASAPTSPVTSAPANPAPPAAPSGVSAHLRIEVLRGSGASGRQFASIVHQLRVGELRPDGRASGDTDAWWRAAGPARAQPSGKPATLVSLAPGRAASTTLTGFSTCKAPNSDAVRVAPPGQSARIEAELVMRGCRLQVDPVALGCYRLWTRDPAATLPS